MDKCAVVSLQTAVRLVEPTIREIFFWSCREQRFPQVTNVFNVSKYFMQIHSIFQGFGEVYSVMLMKYCDAVTKSLGDKISKNRQVNSNPHLRIHIETM